MLAFLFLSTVALLTLAGIFALFLVGTTAVNVLREKDPVTLYFIHPDATSWTQKQCFTSLAIARRSTAERAALVDHCAKYIFRYSVFRKHRCVYSL